MINPTHAMIWSGNLRDLIKENKVKNINDMKISEAKDYLEKAKEVAEAIGQEFAASSYNSSMYEDFIGKYAIIRSRNEGINAGMIVALDDTGIVLKDARRLWHHKPKDKSHSWYEGVSQFGLSDDSRTSCVTPRKAIIEDYSITLCSEIAQQSIEAAVSYAQS